jgi:hypothetical protein
MTERITNAAHENARAKGFHKHGDEIQRRLAAAEEAVANYQGGQDMGTGDDIEHAVDFYAELEFWKTVQSEHYGNRLMLIVGEVVEAHEEIRSGHGVNEIYYGPDGKPEGVPIELADVQIRLDDTIGEMQIDMPAAKEEKGGYNERRAAMHGGRKF